MISSVISQQTKRNPARQS